MRPVERAQLAMMLEVCAFPKPGNVDRCHDFPDTRLEHFLASAIFARPALEEAGQGTGRIGEIFGHAIRDTNIHNGGNTHFGAFILLIPLVYGGDIEGAKQAIAKTDVSDAVAFYKAFALTSVRTNKSDELDVNDPKVLDELRERNMTLLDVMEHSAANDMVAREWTNGFALTRRGADLLHRIGPGRNAIVEMFLNLLATEPDTFIIKKSGPAVAQEVMRKAREVLDGKRVLENFDAECIDAGINPGSIADITIAAIYVALSEGWEWDY
ncbi:MAG: triphosphoribosyl-dephospho-CoA synthase [Methanoregula sp.]|jgi:triphosphoribosyl-dephospho-CoA synthase